MLLTIQELGAQARSNVRCVEAATAYAECADGDGLIIDVREPGEVSQKPVPGSVNIPRGVVEMKIPEKCPDHTAKIALHCATGVRAVLAAEQLKRLGYTNVSAITCGFDEISRAQQELRPNDV